MSLQEFEKEPLSERDKGYIRMRSIMDFGMGMLWMASSLVLTGPQTYYAILTMRTNHWGTR